MRRLASLVVLVVGLLGSLVVVAWLRGWLSSPWSRRHAEVMAQLRDRGTVAVAGSRLFLRSRDQAALVPVERFPRLDQALRGRHPDRVFSALQREHIDGLLVRGSQGRDAPGSVLDQLARLRPVSGLNALALDDDAAIYEPVAPIVISPLEARQLVAVARLVLQGATAPSERLFPDNIRRSGPLEVAVILRDGREPILWRATRGGSIARAMLDSTFAVLDRWSTRQQERYGAIREALAARTLTIAIFYDKGVLGSRSASFLRRAADPRVYSVGYERLTSWEYALPPTPWSPAADPPRALADLAREHGVPAPGYQRPEITLYRFRALQLIEQAPGGEVQIFNPG